jgi:hypothetical protein
MDVFKDRLLEFIGCILMVLVIPVVIVSPFWSMNLVHEDLGSWAVGIIFLIAFVAAFVKFIYWLLIEPFRKSK